MTRLSAISLCGQLVIYVLGLLLARHLGIGGFEVYVVAAATFTLLVTFVPQGLERYALRLLPPLLKRGEIDPLRGYLRFAGWRTLLASLLAAAAVASWALLTPGLSAELRTGLLVSCAALPAGALVHLALEVLTVFGRPVAAAIVFRLFVPGLVLALVCIALLLDVGLRASWALGAWGLSWALALGLMAWQLWRAAPAPLLSGNVVTEPATWAAGARPFWGHRVAVAVMAQAGVVALEALQPSSSAVGAFAAAMATAAIVQVMATATNRVYASRLSLLLEQRDFDGIDRLRVERRRWLALPLLAWLLGIFLFAPGIIGLFQPGFVTEGATALRILAVSTAASTVLSLAPTYLKHRGSNLLLFRNLAIAAALQVLLLVVLVPRFGAVGAASAHALATCFLYGILGWMAHAELKSLRRA